MIKLFFLLSLFSASAFANHPLITKHATSGFTLPEDSFVKDCTISYNGTLKIHVKRGNGTEDSSLGTMTSSAITEMRYLLQLASYRSIVNNGVQCDGGNKKVTGYRNGKSVLLLDIKDCVSYRIRSGWAARRLRSRVTAACGF